MSREASGDRSRAESSENDVPMGPSVSGRLPGIDIIRGIAACSVLLHHATNAVTVIRPPWLASHGGHLHGVLESVFGTLGHWGVGLFFVVSGFCIHLPMARLRAASPAAELSLRSYYRRRFTRIYPPHLVALVLAGAAALLIPDGFYNEWRLITVPTLFQVVVHLLMIHSFFPSARYSINGVLWTISIETHFYVVYPVLLKILRTIRWEFIILFLFCFSIASTYVVGLIAPTYTGIWDENFFGRYWEWVLGAYVAERLVANQRPSWSRWGPFIGLLCVTYLFSLLTEFLPQGRMIRMHVRPFLFAICVYNGARLPPLRSILYRWGLAIGFESYSLYLVHPISISLTCVGLAALGAPLAVQWIASIAASIGFTILYFSAVERPFMRRAARTASAMPRPAPQGVTG
jgi:peptidoglycan/LPS O-acetylase OafA/YrhL